MQSFDIVKNADIKETFRVSRVMNDFDVKIEHSAERFKGQIDFPKDWNIGLILGASGTGKTTIAKQLFEQDLFIQSESQYTHNSVIDDMPLKCSVEEIERMFYNVGFGSVPSWLKPYSVLSNGEKMRVDLAKALLENDFVVFDEFTSVVDRNVAKVTSMAISKAIKKTNKKFIAVTCHRDIIEWLQPDWILDTDIMKSSFTTAHGLVKSTRSKDVGEKSGESLGVIII